MPVCFGIDLNKPAAPQASAAGPAANYKHRIALWHGHMVRDAHEAKEGKLASTLHVTLSLEHKRHVPI